MERVGRDMTLGYNFRFADNAVSPRQGSLADAGRPLPCDWPCTLHLQKSRPVEAVGPSSLRVVHAVAVQRFHFHYSVVCGRVWGTYWTRRGLRRGSSLGREVILTICSPPVQRIPDDPPAR